MGNIALNGVLLAPRQIGRERPAAGAGENLRNHRARFSLRLGEPPLLAKRAHDLICRSPRRMKLVPSEFFLLGRTVRRAVCRRLLGLGLSCPAEHLHRLDERMRRHNRLVRVSLMLWQVIISFSPVDRVRRGSRLTAGSANPPLTEAGGRPRASRDDHGASKAQRQRRCEAELEVSPSLPPVMARVTASMAGAAAWRRGGRNLYRPAPYETITRNGAPIGQSRRLGNFPRWR